MVEDREFDSGEQYMMYSKASLFGDQYCIDLVMQLVNVLRINEIGRFVRNFNSEIWDRYKFDLVYKGLYQKFNQNNDTD